MDKRKLNWITWSFVALTVIVLALMMTSILRRPAEITLPAPDSAQEPSGDGSGGESALQVVEVSPSTVQAAVATLARPQAYRRTVTVEQLWKGGSGSYEIAVAVRGDWTRTDRTMPDGRVRHTITGPEQVSISYNTERQVYTAPVGTITADQEQPIPTYEDLLKLETESITAADYRAVSGVPCIYAEAQEGAYTLRYWVSVETGLLVAAEKLTGEETVYRMAALSVDLTEPTAEEFTLPDGTSLL